MKMKRKVINFSSKIAFYIWLAYLMGPVVWQLFLLVGAVATHLYYLDRQKGKKVEGFSL